jgi:DNA repair exonuclease SbcCD nuclease subunit
MVTAIITDTHFGARGDLMPLMNNQQKFFEKVFFPTLKEYGVREVYHAGDYTDKRKYFNFGTAQWVYQNYREPMAKLGIHEMILVGNHDCYLKQSTAINSIQELCRDNHDVTVVSEPCRVNLDGHELVLLPWICDENRDASMRLIEDTKAALVLGHLELAGFQMYSGLPSMEGLDASLFDKFSLVMSGHFHHKSTNGVIHYLGAPYPMTWGDYQDPRGFHLFDTQTHALTFVENPYSLFSRIVYNDEDQRHSYIQDLCQRVAAPDSPYRDAFVKVIVQKKFQPYWFDLLLDAIYKQNPLDVQISDEIVVDDGTLTFDDGSGVAVDTLALIRSYVDDLTISASKPAVTKYLSDLYHEALSANTLGMS